jgi:hypothetical protein
VSDGGDLAILIHHSVFFTQLDISSVTQLDATLEAQAISATINGSLINIFNVYVPPSSSWPPRYKFDIAPMLGFSDADSIILGNFNAHNTVWFSAPACSQDTVRGGSMVSAVDSSPFDVLNLDAATCLPANGTPSSLDVSLISAHLAPVVTWSENANLNSDHLPLTIDFADDSPPPRLARTMINFKLADWAGFVSESKALIGELPDPPCSEGEKIFREAVLTAAERHISLGFRLNFVPGLPQEAVPLVKCCDNLRNLDLLDPEISRLNEIKNVTNKVSRDKWAETMESCGPKSIPTKYWLLVGRLSGKKKAVPPNQSISFGNIIFTKAKAISKHFNQQFTKVQVTNPTQVPATSIDRFYVTIRLILSTTHSLRLPRQMQFVRPAALLPSALTS